MILTYDEYAQAIEGKLADKPTSVWIATFGFQGGISVCGTVVPRSNTFRYLTRLNTITTGSRILVGIGGRNKFQSVKIQNAAEHWRKLSFRTREDSHLKCWIFFYDGKPGAALAGGRNLGDSNWADASFWLNKTEIRNLVRFYEKLWRTADPVKPSRQIRLTSRGKTF